MKKADQMAAPSQDKTQDKTQDKSQEIESINKQLVGKKSNYQHLVSDVISVCVCVCVSSVAPLRFLCSQSGSSLVRGLMGGRRETII